MLDIRSNVYNREVINILGLLSEHEWGVIGKSLDDPKAMPFQTLCQSWVVPSHRGGRWISFPLVLPTVYSIPSPSLRIYMQIMENCAVWEWGLEYHHLRISWCLHPDSFYKQMQCVLWDSAGSSSKKIVLYNHTIHWNSNGRRLRPQGWHWIRKETSFLLKFCLDPNPAKI